MVEEEERTDDVVEEESTEIIPEPDEPIDQGDADRPAN